MDSPLRPLRALLLLAAVATLTVLCLLAYRGWENRRSELSGTEWTRLLGRFQGTSRAMAAGADGDALSLPPGRAGPSAAADETPSVPERLPWTGLSSEDTARQRAEYAAARPKNVLELQPFRRTDSMDVLAGANRTGRATLVNLHPAVNTWYLLQVRWEDGVEAVYHLLNARPRTQDLVLRPDHPHGITIVNSLRSIRCDLWSPSSPAPIDSVRASRSPYATLCGDEVTVRIPTPGHRTTLEWATDLLRDNIWGGEAMTVFVREKFFQDAYLETSALTESAAQAPAAEENRPAGPLDARVDASFAGHRISPSSLGIRVEDPAAREMVAGRWYPVHAVPGIFVSVIRPNLAAKEILASHRDVVSVLDEVESEALVYLVAFDLDRFELGFAVGTEHPRVGWSERALPGVRDDSLPGPDGIGDIAPLVATGIVPPAVAHRTVATFAGGFKRTHGAFRASELAFRNHGSHYGSIESGVVLSKLHPGLATLLVLDDGSVDMKTWTEADDALLPRTQFARQNGVPIIELDPETGVSSPGALVSKWGAGNWSGSADRKFRTVRAGAAIQESEGKRFLLYAYFSSATPSAMARVFQAYQVRYAMLLDMNALEHTYAAVYDASQAGLVVQHLVQGMSVLDRTSGSDVLPRFLAVADNRDFFYVLRKQGDSPS